MVLPRMAWPLSEPAVASLDAACRWVTRFTACTTPSTATAGSLRHTGRAPLWTRGVGPLPAPPIYQLARKQHPAMVSTHRNWTPVGTVVLNSEPQLAMPA